MNKKKQINILIPWLAGMFIVVGGANIIMWNFARSSWSGVVDKNAYENGLAYNETIAKNKQQNALGWKVVSSFIPNEKPLTGSLEVSFKDINNIPVTELEIMAKLVRPTHEGYDFTVNFIEISAGIYQANTTFPLPGQWDMHISANKNKTEFNVRKWLNIR